MSRRKVPLQLQIPVLRNQFFEPRSVQVLAPNVRLRCSPGLRIQESTGGKEDAGLNNRKPKKALTPHCDNLAHCASPAT
jgi:hypothetical protein